MKKLIKIFACLAMVLSVLSITAAPVSAATYDASAGITVKAQTTAIVNPSNIENQYQATITQSDVYTFDDLGTQYAAVIPVTMPSKGYYYFYLTDYTGSSSYTNLRLYKEDLVSYYNSSSSKDNQIYGSFNASYIGKYESVYVPKAGQYYLVLHTSSKPTDKNVITFKNYFYQNVDNKKLTSGTYQTYGPGESVDRYSKMVLSAAGNVTIQSTSSIGSVAVCNSSKETKYSLGSLTKISETNYKKTVYLPAGTYYIRTTGVYGKPYKLRYTNQGLGSSAFYFTGGKDAVTYYPGTNDSMIYFKYKPAKNGYLTVSCTNTYSGYVTLCNSSKNAISAKELLSGSSSTNNKQVYGVKKGVTYYIRISGAYSPLRLKFTTTGITESSGSSKSAAKTLNKKTTKKGTIVAGNSTNDWYKIKLSTSAKYLNVRFKGRSNDGNSTTTGIRMRIYDTNGKCQVDTYSYGGTFNKEGYLYMTGGSNLKKGTYYVRVQRYNKKSSGWYSLYWWPSNSR